jgi:WD40 repeat protein
VTGSYDCTAKIWGKQSLMEITLLHTISLHNDSVWDLKLKGETLVTGGLDGAIGIFTLSHGNLTTNHFFKVSCTYHISLNSILENVTFFDILA